MNITEIDLSRQISIAQIAFALMVIAFVVVWRLLESPRKGDTTSRKRKRSRQ